MKWRGMAAGIVALVVVAATPVAYAAEAPIRLGGADVYAVLAGAGITLKTPLTTTLQYATVNGDIGSSPVSTPVTGFITVNGTQHTTPSPNDAQTQAAKVDLAAAYQNAAGRPATATIAPDLNNTGKGPGVYTSTSGAFNIKNELVLDAQGDPNAVFIFKAPGGLTANAAKVTLVNGAQACRVYWQTSSAFISVSTFAGTIMSQNSITFDGGTITNPSGQPLGANVLNGRALAMDGAIQLTPGAYTRTSCPDLPNTGMAPAAASAKSSGLDWLLAIGLLPLVYGTRRLASARYRPHA